MLLPIDVIALAVALGALAGKPRASRWLLVTLPAPLVIAIVASFRAIFLPWWGASAAALGLGVIVYSGARPGGLLNQLLIAASAFVLGLAFGPSLFTSGWPSGTFSLLLLALAAPMLLTLWASLRGGAWACQTDRLLGGLCAFAGAALLILGRAA
ncbi:hypothetical protein [Microbaculum sp. FT89]|uniref:hypothetical protein n=1 Tax=Microbaculum sp. FT89 TaxID=3447298 RepID=UPI003F52FE07